MGRIHETVATANAVARTLMLAVAMAAAGGAGWKAYDLYNKPQVQLAVMQQLGLPNLPDPPDVADALAIAACHYYLSRNPASLL